MNFGSSLRALAASLVLTTGCASAPERATGVRSDVEGALGYTTPDPDHIKSHFDSGAAPDAVPDAPSQVRSDVHRCLASPDSAEDRKILTPDSPEAHALFTTLEARFGQDAPYRPEGVDFADVRKSLEACPQLLYALNEMERTGGQPDLIEAEAGVFVFADLSPESPEGRRKLTYKESLAMAKAAGYEMMDIATYLKLQSKIPLDSKTWSWLLIDPTLGDVLGSGRQGDDVYLLWNYWYFRIPGGSFRGLLSVPKHAHGK